jgi:hypothetical protein
MKGERLNGDIAQPNEQNLKERSINKDGEVMARP